jgi:endonuclease/exonuclease/phosphatase family metal-dependent hydrolase
MHRSSLLPALLTVAALTGCPTDPGTGLEPPTEGSFDALTYNVHGLPPAITGDDTTGRMQQIAPLLEGYPVIGLQEDFDQANHTILAEGVELQTELAFDEVLDGRFYGSGLAVLADFDEVDHHHEHFEQCFGTFDNSSDCLASKGFQRVRVDLGGGATVDLYNTHFEAGGGDEDEAARESNVLQVLDAMLAQSDGQAVLFMGDTNLHGDDPVDVEHLSLLTGGADLVDACDVIGCPEPGRIDRFLIRDGDEVTLTVEGWGVEQAFYDDDGVPLSDHDAISARFGWRSLIPVN